MAKISSCCPSRSRLRALTSTSPISRIRAPVPARVLQGVIADRPHLSVPLGPKGLGITAQRLTTKVEQPLNAMMTDPKAGFKWKEMCAIGLYEGWAAGIHSH